MSDTFLLTCMLARLLSLSKQAAMSANTRGKDVNQRVRPKETAAAKTAKAAGKKAANKRKDAAGPRLSSVPILLLSLPMRVAAPTTRWDWIRALPWCVLARDNYTAFRVYLTRHRTDETLLHFR